MPQIVDPLGLLNNNFLENTIFLPGLLDFVDTQFCKLSNTGEKSNKGHKNTQFVVDLLVDIELHLNSNIGTLS